jgi:hypothetical protein
MEFPTLNNSAKLAKRAEKEAAKLAKCAENEALLERMARDGIKPYQLPPDEFHTYIQATFDRCRWVPSERGKDRTGDVDEPVEPAPCRVGNVSALSARCVRPHARPVPTASSSMVL